MFGILFLNSGRDRTRKRKRGRAKKDAWGEHKIAEKWGAGNPEGGGSGEKRNRVFFRSPQEFSLLLIFRTPSLAVSFPSCKFLETPATQALAQFQLAFESVGDD